MPHDLDLVVLSVFRPGRTMGSVIKISVFVTAVLEKNVTFLSENELITAFVFTLNLHNKKLVIY